MMNFLDGLNPPQKEAVEYTEGALMIIAGAGSGKTRVLTLRVANLLQQGIEPYQILSLTFTNKAAKEMRERIEKIVGIEAKSLWMGTFHSIFSRILRIEADRLGYDRNFTIYDTDDSKALLKSILKEQNLDDKVYRINNVLGRISGAKNKLITYKLYAQNDALKAEDAASKMPELYRVYEIYQKKCYKSNAMDFDDLLLLTNILLRDNEDIRQKYQQKFQYVMIDEFQDTNLSQYNIVKMLSQKHQNICVVGDDAQSIYAFRGADIQNILNFEKDYPTLKTVRLEQNYRSTNNIVQAANSVIANNKNQLRKSVWTSNDEGNKIKLVKTMTDTEEGRLVADTIFEEKHQNSWKNEDFAILYRTNAQSRIMEEALRRKNIKYKIVGGFSFYQRQEIKDLLGYLRFTVNQRDEEAFKRIINLPKRGIGDTTVAKLLAMANEKNINVWELLTEHTTEISNRIAGALEVFTNLIKKFIQLLDSKDAHELAVIIAKESGLLKELYEDKTIEGISRYENVQELLNGISEFVDNEENEDKSLSTFLQQITLVTSMDEASKDEDKDKVTLMTIHSAKGLEFKHVFVVGMEENLFPSQMANNSLAAIEEERRLFYVAVTRAEQKLTLTYAQNRYYYGNLQQCEPSRFLSEIDKQFLQNEGGMSKWTRQGFMNKEENNDKDNNTFNFSNQFKKTTANYTKVTNLTKTTPTADFKPSNLAALKVGMKVEHQKFGVGIIKELQSFQDDKKAIINFETQGEKTLLLSFAKLQILE
ncbi:MAG: ATP-dependent DNA helicase [Cytophagales bacterium]|nr:MAG: ATP-dependent DNA helicase [Cytophagales bacterium]